MKRKSPTRTVTRLRKLRRDREWTQRYLGARVGVEGAAICQYETGVARPSPAVAGKLERLLGCPVDELLQPVEVPA